MFDRFHRSPDARSKPGSGLGLAIVRQAAEAHGGFVEAANAPDGGAILRVGFGSPLELDLDQAPAPGDAVSSDASDGVHPQAAPPSTSPQATRTWISLGGGLGILSPHETP